MKVMNRTGVICSKGIGRLVASWIMLAMASASSPVVAVEEPDAAQSSAAKATKESDSETRPTAAETPKENASAELSNNSDASDSATTPKVLVTGEAKKVESSET